MKRLLSILIPITFLFSYGLAEINRSAQGKPAQHKTTNWYFSELSKELILLSAGTEKEKTVLLVRKKDKGWQCAVTTPHFLYHPDLENSVKFITLKSTKPFRIIGKTENVLLEPTKFDTNLFFGWSGKYSDSVEWIMQQEEIEVIIPEMGGTEKVYTFNVAGLKGAMLAAEAKQRNL